VADEHFMTPAAQFAFPNLSLTSFGDYRKIAVEQHARSGSMGQCAGVAAY
jgi:hypothetical protein